MSELRNKVQKIVYEEFETIHKEGYTEKEIEFLIEKHFPEVNIEKFHEAMMGNTCLIKKGEVVNYHIDVYHAVVCGLENRDLNVFEWD